MFLLVKFLLLLPVPPQRPTPQRGFVAAQLAQSLSVLTQFPGIYILFSVSFMPFNLKQTGI